MTIPPSGRATKPTAKVPNAASVPASGSNVGKERRLNTATAGASVAAATVRLHAAAAAPGGQGFLRQVAGAGSGTTMSGGAPAGRTRVPKISETPPVSLLTR